MYPFGYYTSYFSKVRKFLSKFISPSKSTRTIELFISVMTVFAAMLMGKYAVNGMETNREMKPDEVGLSKNVPHLLVSDKIKEDI